jgi:hypothetical protein
MMDSKTSSKEPLIRYKSSTSNEVRRFVFQLKDTIGGVCANVRDPYVDKGATNALVH